MTASGFKLFGSDGGESGIASIQHGEASFEGSNSVIVNISTIDVNKSIVLISYSPPTWAASASSITAKIRDADSLEFSTYSNSQMPFRWTAVEFKGVKSKQSGTYLLGSATTTGSVQISPVDISKSLLIATMRVNSNTNASYNYLVESTFIDHSTLGFRRGVAAGNATIEWQVIEFE